MIQKFDIPLHYEFRISKEGSDWKDIEIIEEVFYQPVDANRHARKLVKKHKVEVRMNSKGSFQGIYFNPTKSNKVIIS